MVATRVYVTQLDKGWDTSIASSLIDEKAASDLLNIRWTEGKIITKRDGFIDVFSGLVAPKCIGQYVTSAVREVLAIDDGKLKKTTSALGTWTNITNVAFNAAATDYSISTVKDVGYIWNKMDGGTTYNGTITARPGTMPSAGFSVAYKGYHIAAGTTSKFARIYISTLTNPSDFTNLPGTITTGPDPDNATEVPGSTVWLAETTETAQFVDLSTSDGEPITLLFEFQDYLIIGKTNSLWSMTFDETNKPVIQLITRAAGCVSPKSAAAVGNDVYLLSEAGPISLGNEKNYATGLRTNVLSERIQQFIDMITPSARSKAVAAYHDHMYILGVPYNGSTTINAVLMLDTRFGGWSLWDTINSKFLLSHIDSNNVRHLYFVQEGSTTISEIVAGYYYDRYEGINAYWKSKAVDAGMLDITKRWTYLTLFMRNVGSTAKCTISTELETLEPLDIFEGVVSNGMGFTSWGKTWLGLTSESDSSGNNSVSTSDEAWRTRAQVESRTTTFMISNNIPGENFYLAGYAWEYKSLKSYYFDATHTF